MKKIALVLGGGAAKGYAHVGVLKVLEKNGIIPNLIIGTSMGALVGGMYASGKTINELENMALKFNSLGRFSLISTLFKGNLLDISKVKNLLKKQLGDFKQEDCKIPFVAVSTELNTGKEHHFTKGILKQNILASISIPGIFPNVKIGENYYCDGGTVNNLAENIAKDYLKDAVVISVDVIGDYAKQVEKNKFKTIETFLNASTLMTTNVIKNRPQYADLRITILQPNISQLDFGKNATIKSMKKGEQVTKKYISKIKKLIEE